MRTACIHADGYDYGRLATALAEDPTHCKAIM